MRVNFGDVVWAEFLDFDGTISKAMFVVCYHECDDIKGSTNFQGLKISSHPRGYQIPLLKKDLPFLAHDSYLNCNRQFPLREDGIISIAGYLNSYYINKMLQQMFICVYRSSYQAEKRHGKEKIFDINRQHFFK